jgi:hypothetical protein
MRGRKVVFSLEQIRYITSEYALLNKSVNDLKKELSVSAQVIANVLRQNNITINKRAFVSKKNKGKTSPNKGRKLSNETRAKIGMSKVGNKNCVGRKLSDKSRVLMSEKRKEYIATTPEWNAPMIEGKAKKRMPIDESKRRELIRSRCKNLIRRLAKLQCYNKQGKTNDILGYGYGEFRQHIEAQFKDGMSWDNRESFHIDHIIPIAAFIRNGNTDPQIINSIHNLQVLSPEQNRKKSDRYDHINIGVDIFDIMSKINMDNIEKNKQPEYEFA